MGSPIRTAPVKRNLERVLFVLAAKHRMNEEREKACDILPVSTSWRVASTSSTVQEQPPSRDVSG
jgi:hypothetical protein